MGAAEVFPEPPCEIFSKEMTTAFEDFWNALETDEALQKRLVAVCSPQTATSIAAEFGFLFSDDEFDREANITNGYRIIWPDDPSVHIKREAVTLGDLRLQIYRLNNDNKRFRYEIERLEDEIRFILDTLATR
jgi:hypothetical protein